MAPRRAGRGALAGRVYVPVTVLLAVALSSLSAVTLVAVTVAVSFRVPFVVGVTTIVIVTLLPPLRLPTLHVTVPSLFLFEPLTERVQLPWVADVDTNTPLAGSWSPTETPLAACWPVLVAVIV